MINKEIRLAIDKADFDNDHLIMLVKHIEEIKQSYTPALSYVQTIGVVVSTIVSSLILGISVYLEWPQLGKLLSWFLGSISVIGMTYMIYMFWLAEQCGTGLGHNQEQIDFLIEKLKIDKEQNK